LEGFLQMKIPEFRVKKSSDFMSLKAQINRE